MATNKEKTSAPKLAAEKSSVTAVAASAAAVGAAGGVNPGTNSPSAPAASKVNEAQPAAGTPSAQPDFTGTSLSEAEKRSPAGADAAAKAGHEDRAGGAAPEGSSTTEALRVQMPAVIAKVRALSPRGFYRGGRFWPAEWTDVREGDLSPEQMAAVVSEKQLALQWAVNGEHHD